MDFSKSCNNYYVTSPNEKHLGQIMMDLEIAWGGSGALCQTLPNSLGSCLWQILCCGGIPQKAAQGMSSTPKQQGTHWPGWEGHPGPEQDSRTPLQW